MKAATSREEAAARELGQGSAKAYRSIRTADPTCLQRFQLAVRDAIFEARATCSSDEYRVLLCFTQALLTSEHLRVGTGDLERFKRDAV